MLSNITVLAIKTTTLFIRRHSRRRRRQHRRFRIDSTIQKCIRHKAESSRQHKTASALSSSINFAESEPDWAG